jgi:hypothetical protein
LPYFCIPQNTSSCGLRIREEQIYVYVIVIGSQKFPLPEGDNKQSPPPLRGEGYRVRGIRACRPEMSEGLSDNNDFVE